MPGKIEDLWKKGYDAASNPSRWDRLKHSGFARKHKKPDQMLKDAISGAVQAIPIPIPIVGTLVTEAVDKGLRWAKNKRNQQKVKSYGTGANLEKQVKHNIKKLDLEELDRARAKVRDTVSELNKQLDSFKYYDTGPCDHIFRLSKGFHYLDKRIELLEARARIFMEVGEATIKWSQEVRGAMEDRKTKSDAKIQKIESTGKKFPHLHDDCEKTLCIK